MGEGYTDGSISNSYARGGIVLQGNPEDVFALTAEVDRSWLTSEAYAEAGSPANPFDARVSPGTDAMNIAKLRVQWDHEFGSNTHATFWAAAARSFEEATDFMAAVPMAGFVAPGSLDQNSWAEYGTRLSFAMGPQLAGDITVAGLSGFDGLETALQVRAGASLAF
jgi:hypothetical protein